MKKLLTFIAAFVLSMCLLMLTAKTLSSERRLPSPKKSVLTTII